MTAKTRRLRELIAGGEFLHMPSAATPLEGGSPRRWVPTPFRGATFCPIF
jgi:hypothetical protein